jgi:hypothetical protein
MIPYSIQKFHVEALVIHALVRYNADIFFRKPEFICNSFWDLENFDVQNQYLSSCLWVVEKIRNLSEDN